MNTLAWWMIGVGAALILVAMVGGHYLQYVIGHDNASVAAALTGVVAGSLLMQGVILRIQIRRTIRRGDGG